MVRCLYCLRNVVNLYWFCLEKNWKFTSVWNWHEILFIEVSFFLFFVSINRTVSPFLWCGLSFHKVFFFFSFYQIPTIWICNQYFLVAFSSLCPFPDGKICRFYSKTSRNPLFFSLWQQGFTVLANVNLKRRSINCPKESRESEPYNNTAWSINCP